MWNSTSSAAITPRPPMKETVAALDSLIAKNWTKINPHVLAYRLLGALLRVTTSRWSTRDSEKAKDAYSMLKLTNTCLLPRCDTRLLQSLAFRTSAAKPTVMWSDTPFSYSRCFNRSQLLLAFFFAPEQPLYGRADVSLSNRIYIFTCSFSSHLKPQRHITYTRYTRLSNDMVLLRRFFKLLFLYRKASSFRT